MKRWTVRAVLIIVTLSVIVITFAPRTPHHESVAGIAHDYPQNDALKKLGIDPFAYHRVYPSG